MARIVGSGPAGVYRQLWRHAQKIRRIYPVTWTAPAPPTGRIMSSLAAHGGLAGSGGIAGQGGGLAG